MKWNHCVNVLKDLECTGRIRKRDTFFSAEEPDMAVQIGRVDEYNDAKEDFES